MGKKRGKDEDDDEAFSGLGRTSRSYFICTTGRWKWTSNNGQLKGKKVEGEGELG